MNINHFVAVEFFLNAHDTNFLYKGLIEQQMICTGNIHVMVAHGQCILITVQHMRITINASSASHVHRIEAAASRRTFA